MLIVTMMYVVKQFTTLQWHMQFTLVKVVDAQGKRNVTIEIINEPSNSKCKWKYPFD